MFFLPKLIHHSVSFSGLFPSSCLLTPLSVPHPPPLPQTCTHRVSSNLAACPWVHTVTKAHLSSLFRCCALVLACTTVSFASTCIFMHFQCRINYLSTCEPPYVIFLSVLAFLCAVAQEIKIQTFVCPTDTALQSLHIFYLFLMSPVWLWEKVAHGMCREML